MTLPRGIAATQSRIRSASPSGRGTRPMVPYRSARCAPGGTHQLVDHRRIVGDGHRGTEQSRPRKVAPTGDAAVDETRQLRGYRLRVSDSDAEIPTVHRKVEGHLHEVVPHRG